MPHLPSHSVKRILIITRRIQAFPRGKPIADDGNTPFSCGVHGEFMNHPSVGNVGSSCVASDHAEAPDESVVRGVNQITMPHPLNGKDVVRCHGDWEDFLGAADDSVQIVTIVIANSAVVVVRGGGAGWTGIGRRQDIVGAYKSDACLGGRIKRCICVHEPERC